MSVETILSTYTHARTDTGTRTHEHSDSTKLNLHNLKRAADRELTEADEDSSTERKAGQVCSLGKRYVFRLHLMIQGGFVSERKGKVIPCRWTEDRKGAGTDSREPGARGLQARSVRAQTQ